MGKDRDGNLLSGLKFDPWKPANPEAREISSPVSIIAPKRGGALWFLRDILIIQGFYYIQEGG
jgi:hypothetical protein